MIFLARVMSGRTSVSIHIYAHLYTDSGEILYIFLL